MITKQSRYVKTYRVGSHEVIEASIQGLVRRKFRHDSVNPSIITEDGTKIWYFNDLVHRTDGPAVIRSDGTQEWFINGQHHRLDGPAIVYPDGDLEYYFNGMRHRLDGPAFISKREVTWYHHGSLHREEGPAMRKIKSNGEYIYNWYYRGHLFMTSDVNTRKERALFNSLTNLKKISEVMEE